jgi:hypothetical protein
MPLAIKKRQRNNKTVYCVEEPNGKVLGCHPTPEKAKRQIAAIEASKHARRGR